MLEKMILKGTTPYYEQADIFPEESRRLSNGELMFLYDSLFSGCQYNCLKCFSDVSKLYINQLPNPGKITELNWEIREKLYREARDLGAKSVVIPGSGEPLLSEQIDRIVDLNYEIGLNTIIFTNGLLLTEEKAKKYFSDGVSIVFSIDCMDEKKYNFLSRTRGNFKTIINNLEAILCLSEKYAKNIGDSKIVQLAINTNPNIQTYNPLNKIDEIGKIHDVIGGRALHFVSFLSPKGKCLKSWKTLVGDSDNSRNDTFAEAIAKYSSQAKCSAKCDGHCSYISNGVVQFAGYWMACPNYGFETNFGKYPEVSIRQHYAEKKEFLRGKRNPFCITRKE